MRSATALPAGPVRRDTTGHRAQSLRAKAIGVLHLVAMATAASALSAQPSFPAQVEGEFDKIELHGVSVVVAPGASSHAALTGTGTSRARMSVKSHTLHVTCAEPCHKDSPATVQVTAPRLSAIRVNDGGKVEIGEGFPTASEFAISIHGGGLIDAASLRADSVTVGIEGGGEATVFASQSLKSDIKGGGAVRYFGDPQLLTNTAGGGSVKRVGAVPSRPAASTFIDPRDGHQ